MKHKFKIQRVTHVHPLLPRVAVHAEEGEGSQSKGLIMVSTVFLFHL